MLLDRPARVGHVGIGHAHERELVVVDERVLGKVDRELGRGAPDVREPGVTHDPDGSLGVGECEGPGRRLSLRRRKDRLQEARDRIREEPRVSVGRLPAREADAPARAETARDVGEGGNGFVEEHDAELAHRDVEGSAGHVVVLHVDDPEGDVGGRGLAHSPPRRLDERGREIRADHRSFRQDAPAALDRGHAPAAADVENAFARCERERVEQVGGDGIGEPLPLRPDRGPALVVPPAPLGGIGFGGFARHGRLTLATPSQSTVSGMDEHEMRRRVRDARVGRLATITSDGRPHLVPCCFALAGDVVYSAIDAKPKSTMAVRRLANLYANPHAALLIDYYSDDWSALWWVRLDGEGRVLDRGAERSAAIVLLTQKYPVYVAEPPQGAVVAIDIDDWRGWP